MRFRWGIHKVGADFAPFERELLRMTSIRALVTTAVLVFAGTALAGWTKTGDSVASFTPPKYRWGSIVGLQDDGMVIHQPNGKAVRVPRWAAQRVLSSREIFSSVSADKALFIFRWFRSGF